MSVVREFVVQIVKYSCFYLRCVARITEIVSVGRFTYSLLLAGGGEPPRAEAYQKHSANIKTTTTSAINLRDVMKP